MRVRTIALVLTVVLLFYFYVLADRAVVLIRDGRIAFVILGIGVLLLPVVGMWAILRELTTGMRAEQLAKQLGAEGGLPVDDLARSQSGRIERTDADRVFLERKAEVEAHPEDWRSWYRLAIAYGDAGDTARGRKAMRKAIELSREK
jgi:cytochrome c-type biogenesis protein CcmH/NrfG